jgi:hypothetical protein
MRPVLEQAAGKRKHNIDTGMLSSSEGAIAPWFTFALL